MSNGKMNANECLDKLAGIEAIDKFIAREFAPIETLNDDDNTLWLHILVTLSFMQRNGHSCLNLREIAGNTYFRLEQDEGDETEIANPSASHVKANAAEVSLVSKPGFTFPSLTLLIGTVKKALKTERIEKLFIYQNGMFYSRRYFEFEQEIAQSLVSRTHVTPLSEAASDNIRALWPAMFPTQTSEQQDWQQVAVAKSLLQEFSVINGGPGTGKTYTVLRLLLALQALDENIHIVLAAPTGKAQQRMTESILNSVEGLRGKVEDSVLNRIPTHAVTIHRLLGLREHTISTKYNQYNTLNLDVLIVDEASMVDLALMARIMRALPAHARLYFIGDADQLPAVELGNVLEQLVANDKPMDSVNRAIPASQPEQIGAVPTYLRQHVATLCPHLPLLPVNEEARTWVHTLQAPQRFKGQVAKVASAIQRGDVEGTMRAVTVQDEGPSNTNENSYALQEGVNLWPAKNVGPSTLQRMAKECFLPIFEANDAQQALTLLNNVRWLTPVRKGPLGVEELNKRVFDSIKHKIKRREGSFYQGQPIMIVKNNHPQRLSNGEVGIIWPDETGKLYAWFEAHDGGLRHISLSRVPQFETVYAMTIHKSQGSEFDNVVLLLPKPESEKAAGLFHRGLVYTGLTRAKTGCLLVANEQTLRLMVQRVDKRFSGLSYAIEEAARERANVQND